MNEENNKRRVPFVDPVVLKKLKLLADGKISELKTTSRSCTIIPSMVGKTILVHNGKDYIPVTIVDDMVGEKLGEYSLTRKFVAHGGDKDTTRAKPKPGAKPAAKKPAVAKKTGGKK